MQQNKENQDHHDFYRDKFFDLVYVIQPFLIDDLASVVRDYCCIQTCVLHPDMIRFYPLLTSITYVLPNRRYPEARIGLTIAEPSCVVCYNLFPGQDCSQAKEKPSYQIQKDSDLLNQNYYLFHKLCAIQYLGLVNDKMVVRQKMHGWIVKPL